MTALLTFTVVFNLLPRPAYSELERRELALLPHFSWQRLWSGQLAEELSHWYSDTEPLRDPLMTLSMTLKSYAAFSTGKENIRFSGTAPLPLATDDVEQSLTDSAAVSPARDENAKLADAGVIVVGEGADVRALMAYGGSAQSGRAFAALCRQLQQRLAPQGVQVYAMPVPLASEFYTPEKARRLTRPQRPVIDYIFSHVGDTVKCVDAYQALADHTQEDIYLRTDHHWAPLGAYYAARCFAEVAGVPLPDLSHFDRHVIHRYVGTMYGYSKDIAVKNAPEDFVYYTPQDHSYQTWFTPYVVDSDMRLIQVQRRQRGSFFYTFKDGSPMAYITFMGGDMKLTEVYTGVTSQRRLLVLKDSYGNAVPGFLFGSFGEVHVVDFRYFHLNLTQYMADHHITDLLLCFNTFNVSSVNVARRCMKLMTQKTGVTHLPDSLTQKPADSLSAVTQPAQVPQPSTSDTLAPAAVPDASSSGVPVMQAHSDSVNIP